MGLVTANAVGMSGIVAQPPNVQIFTGTSGTWYRPAGCTRVYVEVISAGGGGGGTSTGGAGGLGGRGEVRVYSW
jgi:hypothetical protein